MQIYKGLEVITNKHPHNEREGIQHHVMDHINWNEEYYIHRFSEEANIAIDNILSRNKVPIIIGGTHYYLQKLLFSNKTISDDTKDKDVTFTPEQTEILNGPVEKIFEVLHKNDNLIAEKFHPQDRRKLKRALEVFYTTGQKPSELYHEQKLNELEDSSLKYNTLLFWVYSEPTILQDRLAQRVDKMMETGAIDEINDMYKFYESSDPKPDFTSGVWQVIGFKEFIPWLNTGQDKDFKEGLERMKIRTRQYAKYQIKWIKKLLSVELQKESRFNFKYGGKLYLLNASDLDDWGINVKTRGINIAKNFLQHGPGITDPQKPDDIQEAIFPNEKEIASFNSNKRLDSTKNWKHFKCDYCKDKLGNSLIAVGEDNWLIHTKSRRHKKNVRVLINSNKLNQ